MVLTKVSKLRQMEESFETNLANSQKEEMQSQKDYEDCQVREANDSLCSTRFARFVSPDSVHMFVLSSVLLSSVCT